MSFWPQYTVAGLMLLGIGISIARYGERKRDNYDLIDILIAPVITVWLLYMDGFWTGGPCQ